VEAIEGVAVGVDEREDTPTGVPVVDTGNELVFGSPAGTTGTWLPGVDEAVEVMTTGCWTIEGMPLPTGTGACRVVVRTVETTGAETTGNGRGVVMVVTRVRVVLGPAPDNGSIPAEGGSWWVYCCPDKRPPGSDNTTKSRTITREITPITTGLSSLNS
jgi:hypothetical protein